MIWDCFMFRNELAMLEFRLNEMDDIADKHVLVEAPVTHRGVPKPLYFAQHKELFRKWADKIVHVVPQLPDLEPWGREHWQRNMTWYALQEELADDDTVLICDADEIVHPSVKAWRGEATALVMRTFAFAVDWEADEPVPPTSVAVSGKFLREQISQGRGLGEVRDARYGYPRFDPGGWHFTWVGGPAYQAEKLETASCHKEEIYAKGEAPLILDGTRYRTQRDGGGLKVRPVDVDETWPLWVQQRRCPATWFRPREAG